VRRSLNIRRLVRNSLCAVVALTAGLGIATVIALRSTSVTLSDIASEVSRETFVDRRGERLNQTYDNVWNVHDQVPLHALPPLLKQAFITAEDQRFFSHSGADWQARIAAAGANLQAGRVVRGASTISEQVIRMIYPRPRTPWARWLEGFEAGALEDREGKLAVLEFYVNQVPYGARRRGVVQAARYYFDRDLTTLNEKETLALAVLVRAPRWFDPTTRRSALEHATERLAESLHTTGALGISRAALADQDLSVPKQRALDNVQHFLRYTRARNPAPADIEATVHTTLDLATQRSVQRTVDRRLADLADAHVLNAAALVVDHETNEIRAWVVGNAGRRDRPFSEIDAVTTRRQPGSALKPLLYAEAIHKGWSAATMIDDAPLEQSVGLGLHAYHNYSRTHYGPTSVRESLGNSLNIPAVRAIQFVGTGPFLDKLHELGIEGLSRHPDIYGDGLALGNGEVTLLELVQAYTALARGGTLKPLTVFAGNSREVRQRRVFPEAVSGIITDILADPNAREKEFGRHSVLNFSHPTAVKTGTSSDYRDAWSLGYDDRHTVGVWMGNLDYSEMQEITGSTGPALVLRSIFRELNRHRDAKALYRSADLVLRTVCRETGRAPVQPCNSRDEWFIRGTEPGDVAVVNGPVRLRRPINGLQLAMDPRLPDDHEYFEFELGGATNAAVVHWYVNGQRVGTTQGGTYAWKLSRGAFTAYAQYIDAGSDSWRKTESVAYRVN